jgi:hypothetical protein
MHWLVPSLTALVLMLAVEQLPFGVYWWIGAGASGLILMLVLTAEYLAMDTSHRYYPLAEMGLTSISIVLFLILAISLHGSDIRLFYRIPVLSAASLLVYLRIINLRGKGSLAWVGGGVCFLLVGELAASLHYWPAGSVSFGLALTGPLFALIEISDRIPEPGNNFRQVDLFWPGIILLLSWIIALVI